MTDTGDGATGGMPAEYGGPLPADSLPAVIWTALPAAAVLQFGGVGVESTAPSEVRIGHRILQVIPHGHGRSQVVRLISGDPRDYLDRRWQPGAIIDPP